ncbi:MAG: BON domain-containing protein [Planctomycetaceae bacterium]
MTGQTTSWEQLDAPSLRSGEIARAAQDLIRNSPYQGMLRTISCSEHEGILVLHGRVHSYHQKQQAQEAVRHLPGVRCIVNSVEVNLRVH